MVNKNKIIIGSVALVATTLIGFGIYRAIRKRTITKKILENINNPDGFKDSLGANDQVRGSKAFDPNYWNTTGAGSPDQALLGQLSPTEARAIAKRIKASIGTFRDNENAMIGELQKVRSKGQMSLVAYVYQNPPLNYGNLSDDVVRVLTGWFDNPIWIQQVNNHIENLPD